MPYQEVDPDIERVFAHATKGRIRVATIERAARQVRTWMRVESGLWWQDDHTTSEEVRVDREGPGTEERQRQRVNTDDDVETHASAAQNIPDHAM